jgi:hypothetical protein
MAPAIPDYWEKIHALVGEQRRDLTQILSRLDVLAARLARLEGRLDQEFAERQVAAASPGWLARLFRRGR